ncbi:MAG: phosphatase PAP2 family protein [Chloroflexi bacterium]|nr:phosphatase PAP2 family protein [Chloroflexota bacterium]
MLSEIESGIGLDIVVWLQDNRHWLLDGLALGLHYVARGQVLAFLLLLLTWRFDRRLAVQLLFGVLFGALVSTSLKYILQTPRPHIAFPGQVDALASQDGYGLPSGHVLTAIILAGLLGLWFRRRWVWIAGVVYSLIVAWSRMYLGVHYPQDVLASMLIGPLVVGAYLQLYQYIAERIPGF